MRPDDDIDYDNFNHDVGGNRDDDDDDNDNGKVLPGVAKCNEP